MKNKSFVINNVYDFRNRGDSAIVERMCQLIRIKHPDAEIYLASQYHIDNKEYYESEGYKSIPQLLDIPMGRNKINRLILSFISLSKVFLYLLLYKLGFRNLNTSFNRYLNSNAILDAGGGSFFSSTKYKFYLGLYQHIFNLYLPHLLKKKIIIAPQSFGPFFNRHDEFFVAKALRSFHTVMAREAISAEWCDKRNIKHEFVPDIVLSNYDDSFIRSFRIENVRIGVTVMNWSWAIENSNQKSIDSYISKVSQSIKNISMIYNVSVVLIPQVTASHGDSDMETTIMIEELLNNLGIETKIADHNLKSSDMQSIYEEVDIFIGSRMHSCIFALNKSTPTIALAYQHKTLGTFTAIGLEKFVLPIDNFSCSDMENHLKYVIENYTEVSRYISQKMLLVSKSIQEKFLDSIS